jgi:peptidoglycan/LPS O-acetylase OafA/YrhL
VNRVYHADAISIVLLAYFVTLGGAAVMYVVIERPCIAVGRRLSKRMGSPAPAIAQPGT